MIPAIVNYDKEEAQFMDVWLDDTGQDYPTTSEALAGCMPRTFGSNEQALVFEDFTEALFYAAHVFSNTPVTLDTTIRKITFTAIR